MTSHLRQHDDAGVKAQDDNVQLDPREHEELASIELALKEMPHIKDVYYKHEHILIPDQETQDGLARYLDTNDMWKVLAQDFNVQFEGAHSQSPTKDLLHVYGMRGNLCNWMDFSERLQHYNLHQADKILCDWYHEQTIPKTRP